MRVNIIFVMSTLITNITQLYVCYAKLKISRKVEISISVPILQAPFCF